MMTGFASIDKTWLKYYPEGAQNCPLTVAGKIDFRALEKLAEKENSK